MSCVAELNASSQKNASESWNHFAAGSVSATPASAAPMISCIPQIQSRRVFRISTTGLQSGLMTHGKYSHAV